MRPTTKIPLPTFHEKAEVRRNQHAVHFFYNEVLKEYVGRLRAAMDSGRRRVFKEGEAL